MKEYVPILWWGVILAGLALSSSRKVRKKTEKAMKRLDDHFPREAWPVWDIAEGEDASDSAHSTASGEAVAPAGQYCAPTAYEPQRPFVEMSDTVGRQQTPQEAYEPLMRPETSGPQPAYESADAPERAGRHRPLEAAPVVAMDAQRLTGPQADRGADNCESEDIAEDFDLRRAVIYSEILKPKYDE